MREIGGYIELDTYKGKEYHENVLALNCGRNALAYLIKKKNIKKLYVPYFICASVSNAVTNNDCELIRYHIDLNFHPIIDSVEEDSWVYIVNYYGQLSNDVIKSFGFEHIIVDQAQGFFEKPIKNIDTIYTCRKFFGVADGAYLFTDNTEDDSLEQDYSYDRMRFLLGRYEKGANEFYSEFVDNNHRFNSENIKLMSKLTHNLLRAIDYEGVAKQRTENFEYLNEQFKAINKLTLTVPFGAFAYPLYVENGAEIRKELQKDKIYIPTLWPDVFDVCDENDLEYDMAKNILPIPIDQRYGIENMKYILTFIEKYR